MLVIIGAGGHARETLVVARALGIHDVGFVADRIPKGEDDRLLAPYLGASERLEEHEGDDFVVGIGSGQARQSFDAVASTHGLRPATLIHPRAEIDPTLIELGPGAVVFANVTMTTHITAGRHCHFNRNSTVGHDVVLGDFVTVHPGAIISGRVSIGDGATLGAGSVVLEGRSVGSNATVGAGAVVAEDVEPDATVVGIPARPRSG